MTIKPSAASVLALLADQRLVPYKDAFKPANDDELLGAYQWGQAVSASLHPLLGLAEVVLRNAIHLSLSLQCSTQKSTSFPWYDRALAGHVQLKGKSLAKIEGLLCEGTPPIRKHAQPTPDLVVSRLSLGFWPNVMEELNGRHAPRTFSDVFSHHPHSKPRHWSIETNKQQIVLRLKRLQDLRNRICHFEAIWKPHWVGAQVTHWSHGVKGLRGLHDDLVVLLGWCAPDAVQHYQSTFGWNWFNRLCTTDAVLAFMTNPSECALLPPFPPKTP